MLNNNSNQRESTGKNSNNAVPPVSLVDSFLNATPEDRNTFLDLIGEKLQDILWNGVYYTANFNSESATANSTTQVVTLKEVDTTEGGKFDPALDSRFRVTFYLNSGASVATLYIVSPAISTDPTFATSVPLGTNEYLSYVGIKVVATEVFMVASINGTERTVRTSAIIDDDTTHNLEIYYRAGESADIFLDTQKIGSISAKIQKSKTNLKTYYPYMFAISASSGSAQVTMENYEFIQKKNASAFR